MTTKQKSFSYSWGGGTWPKKPGLKGSIMCPRYNY